MSLHLLRRVGRARLLTARELLAHFAHLPADEKYRFMVGAELPTAAGGSQLAVTATANVSLTTTQATLVGPLLGLGQAPLQLALGFVSQVTGVAAGAGITANIVRNDTSAIIGAAVVTNNGAGAGAVGGVDPLAVVPAGVTPGGGILLQAAASSGTATAVGSATAPISLVCVGIA